MTRPRIKHRGKHHETAPVVSNTAATQALQLATSNLGASERNAADVAKQSNEAAAKPSKESDTPLATALAPQVKVNVPIEEATRRFQASIPMQVLPISPQLAALHSSRHTKQYGEPNHYMSCRRCGHFFVTTRIVSGTASKGSPLSGSTSGRRLHQLLNKCAGCGNSDRKPIINKRKAETWSSLPTVRMKRKISTSALEPRLSPTAPSTVSDRTSMITHSTAGDTSPALPSTRVKPTLSQPSKQSKKKRRGLEGLLAKSREERQQNKQEKGKKLADFLQDLS